MGHKRGRSWGEGWGFVWRFAAAAAATATVVILVNNEGQLSARSGRPADASAAAAADHLLLPLDVRPPPVVRHPPPPVPEQARPPPEVRPAQSVVSSSPPSLQPVKGARLIKHVTGWCVTPTVPEDETDEEDKPKLVLADCKADPANNVLIVPAAAPVGDGDASSSDEFAQDEWVNLMLGQKCAEPQEESSEPKLVFTGDCARSNAKFKKLVSGSDLFILQHVVGEKERCIVPYEGKDKPGANTHLTIHADCSMGRPALQYQTSDLASVVAPGAPPPLEAESKQSKPGPAAERPAAVTPAVAPAVASVSVARLGEGGTTLLKHVSGMCVGPQDDPPVGEDSTILVFVECDELPARNIHLVPVDGSEALFRFQLGEQCGHPEVGEDAPAEPRLAFPADCKSTKHEFGYSKLEESDGSFALQWNGEEPLCIHPSGGSAEPQSQVELINHRSCEGGRPALRFKVEASPPGKALAAGQGLASQPAAPVAPPAKGKSKFEPFPLEVPCHYMKNGPQSSRPGKPCLPPADFWPYKGQTAWRMKLAERILAAVTPHLKEADCGGYFLMGDQTWCNRAFDGSHGRGIIGLSFGIEERDMWSELISQKFKLPVKLYDCFIPPAQSPPIAGKLPNGTKKCSGLDFICYANTYTPYRWCLAAQEISVEGKWYTTLIAQLKGLPRLSVHLKIDVEGSEWAVLEQLMDSPEDWDKIRTLDMEIHFGSSSLAELPQYKDQAEVPKLERQVAIMERLTEKFHCTGSTLEVYRQGWAPQDNCGKAPCDEPVLYLPSGFQVVAFAVSYVHKELIGSPGTV